MFRTELNIPTSNWKISLNDKIFSIGSCFANTMGGKLQTNKWPVLNNPFGIIFNPTSVTDLLNLSIDSGQIDSDLYLNHEERWLHYGIHSQFNASEKAELEAKIQDKILETGNFIKESKVMILTLGSAFVHYLASSGKIVANNHKQPAALFQKKLLKPEEITHSIIEIYHKISALNPKLKWIITVSPVRHIKETLPLNNVSKSTLRLACHTLTEEIPEITYFPAYELLLDDLRDYRFYADDMLHPSENAENYIWEKFCAAFMDKESLDFLKEWQKISKALTHRPFNPKSKAHQKFVLDTIEKMQEINQKVNVSEEIRMMESYLV